MSAMSLLGLIMAFLLIAQFTKKMFMVSNSILKKVIIGVQHS
jgi:hypothetical protein